MGRGQTHHHSHEMAGPTVDRTSATLTPGAPRPGDSGPDMDEALRRARSATPDQVRAVLLDTADQLTADQLTADDPADTITPTVWTAEVRDAAAGRYGDGPTGQAVKLRLFTVAPSPRRFETRGEFALRIRAAAGTLR